jgi:hypothetical protein
MGNINSSLKKSIWHVMKCIVFRTSILPRHLRYAKKQGKGKKHVINIIIYTVQNVKMLR